MSHDIVRDAREDQEDAEKWRHRDRWQLISNAPKDGTLIDLFGAVKGHMMPNSRQVDCLWGFCDRRDHPANSTKAGLETPGWMTCHRTPLENVTHWMPRPADPTL